MDERREFVAFIHGMGAEEPDQALDKLMGGIKEFCDGKGLGLQTVDDRETDLPGQRNLKIGAADGSSRLVTIQEAYWGDLRPRLSTASVPSKIMRGLGLIVFWLYGRAVWRSLGQNRYMLFTMCVSTLIVLAWYYGAIAAAVSAVGSGAEIWGLGLPDKVVAGFKAVGEAMGGWYVWAIVSVVLALIPTTAVIDIAFGSKCYLQNRNGMFHRVCGRLGRILSFIGRRDDFDRVTVLAHSFGSVVAVEALANYVRENAPKVRVITMGSPLLLVTAKSERVRDAMQTFLENDRVESWVDFHSPNDWLCTRAPVPEDTPKYRSSPITSTVPIDEKIKGESHGLYFTDWDVMEVLFDRPKAIASPKT